MRQNWRTALVIALTTFASPLAAATPDLATLLSYPFIAGLTAARDVDRIAWTGNTRGVRTVYTAAAPDFNPQLITVATSDDGQELTGLIVSPDGKQLAWVRGGDHDANWEEAGRQPNPAGATDQPKLTVWVAATTGGGLTAIGEGDAPALANGGQLAFVRNGELWVGDVGQEKEPLPFTPAENQPRHDGPPVMHQLRLGVTWSQLDHLEQP